MKLQLLSLLVTVALASMGAQAAVTDKMIDDDAASTGDVLSWGIGTQGQRYSPLKQINTGNHRQAGAGVVASRSVARSSAARSRSR